MSVPKNIELWRAKVSCRIGMDKVGGTSDNPTQYAVYALLSAIHDIVLHLEKLEAERAKGQT